MFSGCILWFWFLYLLESLSDRILLGLAQISPCSKAFLSSLNLNDYSFIIVMEIGASDTEQYYIQWEKTFYNLHSIDLLVYSEH